MDNMQITILLERMQQHNVTNLVVYTTGGQRFPGIVQPPEDGMGTLDLLLHAGSVVKIAYPAIEAVEIVWPISRA